MGPGWDTVDSTATVLASVMEVMAMVDSTDMARGPPMLRLSLRPMPGWDTVDSTATVVWGLAMVVMAMVDLDTAMERGLLMLRPSQRLMPGWDTVDSTATVVLALAMVVMVVTAWDTAMERGLLMLSLRLMPGTADMVAFMAMDSQFMVATAMDCGKMYQIPRLII